MTATIIDPATGKLEKTNDFNRYEGRWEFAAGHPVEIMVNLYTKRKIARLVSKLFGLAQDQRHRVSPRHR